DTKNNHGNTALMLSVINNQYKVISALLDKKVKVNIRNNNKKNALDLAKINNEKGIIELISNYKADNESLFDLVF
ncbi:MAG: ankyrin repeat domain-containing protein, partial [Gammaproteobacteria bacterium]|nr:ankyrin repeat domain-containing protein [Gammaproteobacteria bacterium]